MRQTILQRAVDSINATLLTTQRVLQAKSSNKILYDYVNSGGSQLWLNETEMVSTHYQYANQFPFLENTGLLFQQNAAGNATYMAAYANGKQIYYQDASTNFILRGSQVLGVNNDYTLQLNSTTTVIRSDWIPNLRFPVLGKNGISPGQAFWTTPIYTPIFRTFLIPMFWPVWRGFPIGVAGEGNYHAAHFVMLSIKSLDNFLQTVQLTPNGVLALVDGNTGNMLASSAPGISQNGTQNSVFTAINNPNALVSTAASFLATLQGNGTIQSIQSFAPQQFSFPALGDDILVNAVWFVEESKGLKWLLVLIIPSNDFLAGIKQSLRDIIIFVCCFCVGVFLVGLLLSWAITAPLRMLKNVMTQATNFDFSALQSGYLSRRSWLAEISTMEDVFNAMMVKFAEAIKSNRKLVTGSSQPDKSENGVSSTFNSRSMA
ncbi:hypothetical protein HDV05_001784 [Chytridiales sp. JEL 0842]|nr:hypothetical protein HDV05_001784 [Chytridiales sp. JEL 0842]